VTSIAKVYRKQNLVCDPEFVLQCCQQLVDADERPTDRWIRRYVQLNILSRQISDIFNYYSPKNSKIMGEASICTMVDSFKRELENLTQAIRGDALDQGKSCGNHHHRANTMVSCSKKYMLVTRKQTEAFLLREVQFLDIWIHEVAFHDVLWEKPISGIPTTANPIPSARVNMLWHCLTAAKVYATNFLDIPRVQMFQLPFPAFSKICYVLIIFCKMVFFHAEKDFPMGETEENRNSFILPPSKVHPEAAWDAVLAACEGEFYRMGSALQEKFAALVTSTGSKNGECDAMWSFAFFMKRIMTGYERRMKKRDNSQVVSGCQQPDASNSISNSNSNTNSGPIQHPPSMSTYSYIPHDRTTNGAGISKERSDANMMDMGAIAPPFDMSGVNIPPDWVQDMAWDTIMDDIMMMPVTSW
jgi:hypothetical protein